MPQVVRWRAARKDVFLSPRNVLGVAAATAASIMAISKIFDGVSDLIMGRIVDKTKWPPFVSTPTA